MVTLTAPLLNLEIIYEAQESSESNCKVAHRVVTTQSTQALHFAVSDFTPSSILDHNIYNIHHGNQVKAQVPYSSGTIYCSRHPFSVSLVGCSNLNYIRIVDIIMLTLY
jgi:hypothetical protein